MGRFSTPKRSTRAAPKPSTPTKPISIPKATEIVEGSPGKKRKSDETVAPVELHVCNYADCGGVLNDNFGMGDRLYQVQLVHEARPSVCC